MYEYVSVLSKVVGWLDVSGVWVGIFIVREGCIVKKGFRRGIDAVLVCG